MLHLRVAESGWSARILTAGPWLTWPVMLTEMANGWWGARKALPLAAEQSGALGAASWQEAIVSLSHLIGAIRQLGVPSYEAGEWVPGAVVST